MRVIGGQFRSRRIQTIRGLDVRPTPDRLRESLFSVLTTRLPGRVFIDAYAGCGSVGIEALSRGAGRVIFIEKNPAAAEMIRGNLRALGVSGGFTIQRGKASVWLARLTADIVFLDPPYPLEKEYGASLNALGANPPTFAIAQHDIRQELEESYGVLRRTRVLRQGDNALTFFEQSD